MTYETITLEQLNNRAPNAHHRGDCDIIETPERFFSVQYWSKDRGCWWNCYEAVDQEKAEAELTRLNKMTGGPEKHIVMVVAPIVQSTEQPAAKEGASSPAIESRHQKHLYTTEMKQAFITSSPRIYLEYVESRKRYEAQISARTLCVDEDTLDAAFNAEAADPANDEYKAYHWLLRSDLWEDQVGKNPGVFWSDQCQHFAHHIKFDGRRARELFLMDIQSRWEGIQLLGERTLDYYGQSLRFLLKLQSDSPLSEEQKSFIARQVSALGQTFNIPVL